jgi:hypothetical protein
LRMFSFVLLSSVFAMKEFSVPKIWVIDYLLHLEQQINLHPCCCKEIWRVLIIISIICSLLTMAIAPSKKIKWFYFKLVVTNLAADSLKDSCCIKLAQE